MLLQLTVLPCCTEQPTRRVFSQNILTGVVEACSFPRARRDYTSENLKRSCLPFQRQKLFFTAATVVISTYLRRFHT